jgi:hypothetical protein
MKSFIKKRFIVIKKYAFFLIFFGCNPLYRDQNAQHVVFVKQINADKDYVSYRLKEELERRSHYLPSKQSFLIEVTIQETFSPLVHLENINEGRSLGLFQVSVLLKSLKDKSNLDEISFSSMASYTPDVYQEFSNIQAKNIIEEQMAVRLSEEIIMRLSQKIVKRDTQKA